MGGLRLLGGSSESGSQVIDENLRKKASSGPKPKAQAKPLGQAKPEGQPREIDISTEAKTTQKAGKAAAMTAGRSPSNDETTVIKDAKAPLFSALTGAQGSEDMDFTLPTSVTQAQSNAKKKKNKNKKKEEKSEDKAVQEPQPPKDTDKPPSIEDLLLPVPSGQPSALTYATMNKLVRRQF